MSFIKYWLRMQWQTMGITGNGYKKHSLQHTGVGDDRRNDKRPEKDKDGNIISLPVPKLIRRYYKRYNSPARRAK